MSQPPPDSTDTGALAEQDERLQGQIRADNELRILVLAPISNDARLTAQFLEKAGVPAIVCSDIPELCERMNAGCGALLLAEEALATNAVNLLISRLEVQPSWSDLPIIMITGAGDPRAHWRHLVSLGPIGNVSIVERPVRPETLVSASKFAMCSRRRQYQVRTLLEERRRNEDVLRETDRRKDEFLAMLAHELRNPLASVANAVEVLKSLDDMKTREWAVSVIDRQTTQLAHLIDDLLDVSRITSGKIHLRKEVFDAGTILDRARESVRPLMVERRHELICHYSHGALWLDADPTRVEQIILNLLTNAAKYTPAGGHIEMSARQQGDEILVTVQDSGIGIAPNKLPEMFQLFAQGERSIARSEGGLGIGLTIVQRLAEMHGGRVDAHSDGLNRGSTFTVCLPATTPPISSAAIVPAPNDPCDVRALRVLIVDDNVDTAQGLERLLRRDGHKTTLANDGRQALDRAREHSPDVVVLDIGLPGMDGFEVVRHMRAEPRCSAALIIAVTGYGQNADRRRAREAGFDHHLIKPVEFRTLKKLLKERFQRTMPTASATPSASPGG